MTYDELDPIETASNCTDRAPLLPCTRCGDAYIIRDVPPQSLGFCSDACRLAREERDG